MQRDQRSLVGTALLLTGSHEQAIRLVLRSFHTVALSWPPPVWENPTTHAQIALYRRFLQRPSAAGATALVRLPARQRLLVVACLHDGRTRAEMAAVLGVPEDTVRTEIAEAVETLTKGDEKRLVARMATAAGEASVPDLSALCVRTLKRRRARGVLLTVAAALVPVALIVAFTVLQRGEVLNSALSGRGGVEAIEGHEPVRAIATPTPAPSPSGSPAENGASPGASPGTTPSKAASPKAVQPGTTASPAPWRAPRTSSVIRYAVPARCPGEDVPARDGDVVCAGWTLRLAPGASASAAAGDCEGGGPCESTVSVPDAAQRLAHGDGKRPRLDPAISRDGRRIAYLSAAERRYVAHDLGSGVKRYLSPVLVPADTEKGTLVSVSPDGRHFTVVLGGRRLRTDFTTGALTPVPATRELPADRAAPWLGERYGTWAGSPNGRYAAAVGGGKAAHRDARGPLGLHVIDTAARRVLRRLPLPDVGRPAEGAVVSWLNGREVVVRMSAADGGEPLGLFRVNAVTGRAHRLAGLPADAALVLGAAKAL
ncbi:sigma factor-like helix-turn-helix DNA-binding protein [Streptosporangium sp. NPDC050855]|uniref:sigma factor-like helix-turn-helix DNA-binding protein n=1 Tax=Streptosporangium sp. NPDC050855 TaxID=3366194 RepID=UPI0037B15F3F